jgi:hypothetical protein
MVATMAPGADGVDGWAAIEQAARHHRTLTTDFLIRRMRLVMMLMESALDPSRNLELALAATLAHRAHVRHDGNKVRPNQFLAVLEPAAEPRPVIVRLQLF